MQKQLTLKPFCLDRKSSHLEIVRETGNILDGKPTRPKVVKEIGDSLVVKVNVMVDSSFARYLAHPFTVYTYTGQEFGFFFWINSLGLYSGA